MDKNSLSPPCVHSAAAPGPESDQDPPVCVGRGEMEKFVPRSGRMVSASIHTESGSGRPSPLALPARIKKRPVARHRSQSHLPLPLLRKAGGRRGRGIAAPVVVEDKDGSSSAQQNVEGQRTDGACRYQ